MNLSVAQLKGLLVAPGHISEKEFQTVVLHARELKKDITDVLIEEGYIQDEQLGKLLAEEEELSFVVLSNQKIDEAVLNFIPERVARAKEIIAFMENEEGIHVGMVNPQDLSTVHLISKRTGKKVIPYLATKRDLEAALSLYKNSIKEEFTQILRSLQRGTITRAERDELTVTTVDTLLHYGYRSKASDIHVEPHEEKVVVRFRIDGVMHDALELPKELLEYIVTRVKILAKIQTDQHRSSQDGRFRFEIDGDHVDVRVSIVPVTKGENIVMRILSAHIRSFTLNSLGMAEEQLNAVRNAVKNPHGMVLVVGPTGSGKTTTVYAMLKILNTKEVHISSIEDPVEYDIEGISQIQADPKADLTFANGLRAIVRQDPDIIFVGEIRDRETADISVNAALTGHLVLSTLHANDASTTLHRFFDMGIEPFLIATTVNVVIAQRLVRKICTACRVSYEVINKKPHAHTHKTSLYEENTPQKQLLEETPQIKEILKQKGYADISELHLYKGNGCDACAHTGYSGRIGIFEVLPVADVIKDLIMQRAHHDDILNAARKEGMTTMFKNGIDAVLNGVTTFEEVLRVIYE